jgi:uncharacterized protein (DUF362 family)
MEGDGPIMGRARNAGFVAMGADVVAVDAECARVIGLDAAKIEYLYRAARYLGHIDPRKIEHRGEAPTRFRTRFDVLEAYRHLQLGAG